MFKDKEPTALEMALNKALLQLEVKEINTAEYAKALDAAQKLHEMKEEESSHSRVSRETWAILGANLLGIILIIRHEHANVITSRAMQLLRPKQVT